MHYRGLSVKSLILPLPRTVETLIVRSASDTFCKEIKNPEAFKCLSSFYYYVESTQDTQFKIFKNLKLQHFRILEKNVE